MLNNNMQFLLLKSLDVDFIENARGKNLRINQT